MAAKKSTGASNESEQLAAAAEELMKAAELLKNQAADAPKKASTKTSSAAKKSASGKSTTAKSKSTTSAKPKSTSASKPKTAAASKPKTATAAKPKKKPTEKATAAEEAAIAEPAEEVVNEPIEQPKAAEPVEEPKAEEPVEEPKAEEPVEEPKAAEPVEEPKAEEPVEEPKAEEPVEEPKAEEPVEEPKAAEPAEAHSAVTIYCPKCGAPNTDGNKYCLRCGAALEGSATIEPKSEVAATEKPAEKPAKKVDMSVVADKTENFITKKGKLPIFIIVNALFLVCSILLMVVSFNINSRSGGKIVGHNYNLFSYLGNAAEIKGFLAGTALSWAGGAYAMIGILMIIAMLVPIALIVKNLILLFAKKNRNVYKFDAVIVFAFMLFYITIINFYGANVPAGPMISFIIAAVDLAFTIFSDLLINRKNGQKFPFFSIAVIALVVVCELIFTSLPVFTKGNSSFYGASAASTAGGFMFVTYLIAVLALIVLVVMQLWKLPSIIDIIMPAVAAVCSLITLIVAGAGKPTGYSIGGGFVVGTILTVLLAVAYLLFSLIPALKKFKVQLNNVKPVAVAASADAAPIEAQAQPETDQPETAQAEDKTESAPAEEPAKDEPVKEEAEPADTVFCPECGAQNTVNSKFCYKCGKKLKD